MRSCALSFVGLTALAVSACGTPPHRATARLPDACVDLRFALHESPWSPRRPFELEVAVRNHCRVPAPFDAARLSIEACTREGRCAPVALFDPRGELGPRHVDALMEGEERIGLVPRLAFPEVARICVAPHAAVGNAQPKSCFVLLEPGTWRLERR